MEVSPLGNKVSPLGFFGNVWRTPPWDIRRSPPLGFFGNVWKKVGNSREK